MSDAIQKLRKRKFKDQLGREIELPNSVSRIVSLVPSQTELLYDLGAGDQVVAITKFCVHPPEWLKNKRKVGGTKTIRLNEIIDLKPDLIIANKEENDQESIEILAQHFPVWISDVKSLDDAISMIQTVAAMIGKPNEAESLIKSISLNFNKIIPATSLRALYLIWKSPYMTVNADTFIHDMLQRSGLKNVCADRQSRYPEITQEDLIHLNPQLILLSSEPYPFKAKHVEELQSLLPQVKIVLVDGEMFSWYGSRLRFAPDYFESILQN